MVKADPTASPPPPPRGPKQRPASAHMAPLFTSTSPPKIRPASAGAGPGVPPAGTSRLRPSSARSFAVVAAVYGVRADQRARSLQCHSGRGPSKRRTRLDPQQYQAPPQQAETSIAPQPGHALLESVTRDYRSEGGQEGTSGEAQQVAEVGCRPAGALSVGPAQRVASRRPRRPAAGAARNASQAREQLFNGMREPPESGMSAFGIARELCHNHAVLESDGLNALVPCSKTAVHRSPHHQRQPKSSSAPAWKNSAGFHRGRLRPCAVR